MPSSWGARRGMKGYDKFRTGLTYKDVFDMLYSPSDDPADWKHRSRGQILWLWHKIKMDMWERLQKESRSHRKRAA